MTRIIKLFDLDGEPVWINSSKIAFMETIEGKNAKIWLETGNYVRVESSPDEVAALVNNATTVEIAKHSP